MNLKNVKKNLENWKMIEYGKSIEYLHNLKRHFKNFVNLETVENNRIKTNKSRESNLDNIENLLNIYKI